MKLQGKTLLVCGIANERSIASAIAQAAHAAGARLIATYQDERLKKRVEAVMTEFGDGHLCCACDVSDPASIKEFQEQLQAAGVFIDGVVHAIAYGRLHDDDGNAISVMETSEADFSKALQISAHSLSKICQAVTSQLNDQASVVAITYAGATQIKPGYNIMGVAKAALEAEIRYLAYELGARGIRVNGISAGPIRTLASSAVPGFKQRLEDHAERSLLRRNINAEEVAQTAQFLLSDAASGISGEIIFVDAGAHLRA